MGYTCVKCYSGELKALVQTVHKEGLQILAPELEVVGNSLF